MTELKKKPLFNPEGDLDVRLRRMIGGNTTNLNDFNNMKYAWADAPVPCPAAYPPGAAQADC